MFTPVPPQLCHPVLTLRNSLELSRVSSPWKSTHWRRIAGHGQISHRLCSPAQSHWGNRRMPRKQNQSISPPHLNLRVTIEIKKIKGDKTTHLIHKFHLQWENCRKLPGPLWFDLASITIHVYPSSWPSEDKTGIIKIDNGLLMHLNSLNEKI